MRYLLLIVMAVTSLQANLGQAVWATFKGQILITRSELPNGKGDKETIARIKTEILKAVTGESHNGETEWRFNYSAFLKQSSATGMKLEFLEDAKARRPIASRTLDGVDAKSSVAAGEITISTADGLKRGRTYFLRLVNSNKQVLASTTLGFK